MKTTIYIIRHGQTNSNACFTYQGITDNPLNETGRKQAAAMAKRFEAATLDAVLSSPLKRAVDTALCIRGDIEKNILLAERNFGAWDDLTYEEICAGYTEEVQAWERDWKYFRPPSGESAADVQLRAEAFAKDLKEKYSGKTVAVVSHLGFIRHLIAVLLELPMEALWHFRLDNCSVATIEITDGFAVLKI